MKNKILAIFFIFFTFSACKKNINDLKRQEINYSKLPAKVRKVIFKNNENFIELNMSKRYSYNTKKTFLPWIYKGIITNIKSNKQYEVSNNGQQMGGLYVVYGDSLYISNQYNIYEKDSITYSFTKFLLK
ncbi:hypothetical protein [Chryseobacterium carnipullorum]|uniref:hypothetical protein n=1 Tax=Chryseobacterium carnipullorum TaxID=1124835 RepID=UPI000E810753|nr:hypothetical protein [Chryseobacterium carnipullorum]HBV17309.1 hypothetical protein [Chryseobacterium carnipullorum]